MFLSFSICGNGHESYTLGTVTYLCARGSNQTQHVDLNIKSALRIFFCPLFILMVLRIYLKHFKHWLLYITYLDIKYFNEIKCTQLLLIICYPEA